MKFRSSVFLTLSLIVHAVCIGALTLSHFKSLESPNGSEVEVTMGEGEAPVATLADASDAVKTDVQPTIKPIEPVKEEPLPKKVAPAAPKPKKIVKARPVIATELPAKEQPSVEPENMNPKIEEADAVAVAEPEQKQEAPKEEAPKFVPVKEKVSAEPSADAEPADKTEAKAAPVPAEKPVTTGQAETTPGPLGQGGDTKADAVNYLELKQFSGNKPPQYPLNARRDQRQGEVGLLYRVTKDGRVTEVQVEKSSGHSDLDDAALKSISKFKFVPGQEGWAKHSVVFKLNGVATALPSKLRAGKSAATE